MSYGQNTQIFNAKQFKKVEKEIGQARKRLEELRLEDESQNTRLLKIQQKERVIDNEYKDRKKKMEDTLEVLAFEAKKFSDEQKKMNEDLEAKKEALVMANDRKKRLEDERMITEKNENLKKVKQIQELKEEKQQQELIIQIIFFFNRAKLAELNENISKHREYEDFLKKVLTLSEDFQSDDKEGESNVKQIIQRYKTLKDKERDFKNVREKIESEKDNINKEIIKVRSQIEDETYSFTSRYNDLKYKIDDLNNQNRKLESEIEGKLNENNTRQTEFAQIIMAIKNLYIMVKFKQDENDPQTTPDEGPTKNIDIIQRLAFIKDKIKFLQDLKEKWISYLREKEKESAANQNPH